MFDYGRLIVKEGTLVDASRNVKKWPVFKWKILEAESFDKPRRGFSNDSLSSLRFSRVPKWLLRWEVMNLRRLEIQLQCEANNAS